MKHLKTFEVSKINSIGGLSLDSPYLISDNENVPYDAKFRIGDYVNFKNITTILYKVKNYYVEENWRYECFIVDIVDKEYSRTWVTEDEIVITPKYKVEEYLMKNDINKYNL